LEKIIELKTLDIAELLGVGDEYITLIESKIPARIIVRGDIIKIDGETTDVNKVFKIFREMMETLNGKGTLNLFDVENIISVIKYKQEIDFLKKEEIEHVIHYGKNGAIRLKTEGQKSYVDLVKNNDVVFSIGPAGTGKTFLAVTLAVSALEQKKVDKIILCRPAVEAGEHLGFLPGDLKDKVDPYFAPLYDSLYILYDRDKLKKLLECQIIEIAPLAYMRGRTLDRAFMILDEAQNTTAMQMKMFLTRLGVGSRAIVTGDITQIDLKNPSASGLLHAVEVLKDVNGIGFVRLNQSDIVRHSLVMKIIDAYDKI